MELRPALCEPDVRPDRLAALCTAIEQIEDLHGRGEPTDGAVAALNADTGNDYELYDILSYHSSMSTEEFARSAAWPAWPRVPDITHEELIEIVRRALTGDEHGYYLRLLDVNVAHPAPAAVIYHPPSHMRDDASPEAVVDEILRYRQIAL
ncbi:hypothetical protein ACIA5D_37735 [Actinoplanes sp. NPDC051513]|uniref:hypothetical protein n=1 Tax=Actinoplanes sp. NPDC051513 TaxID=3363908 RepID=UPI0037B7237F